MIMIINHIYLGYIFRPITLTYLLGFLWNIRPKKVAKLTSGYNASYKGT